ncbi:MAG: guanine deaminase [Mycobacteriales bacterium]
MTLYRARVLDTPGNPFDGAPLRADADTGLLVAEGAIAERGDFASVRARHPSVAVVDLRDGLLLPGFVDTHVHYPQVRAIGALGMPLLDWLEHRALPEEARLHDPTYAAAVAREFVTGLTAAGTTTALVFGSHFSAAVDELFAASAGVGLRVTSGLVVGDRLLRPDLHTTPDRAYEQGRELADRWHSDGRARYAVTPRFALSCSDELLAACAALHRDVPGSWFTSHINENPVEVETVRKLCGTSYLDSYDRHELVGDRSVLAHNVHPTEDELRRLAVTGATVAHCPTSNAALGSGLFPLDRHLEHGVRVTLGTDVGAGAGFSMFKEGLQAYFVQQLRGVRGVALTATHLLYLATAAGAQALGRDDEVGDLSVGKRFDAVHVRPADGTPLALGLHHADSLEDALARTFTLATPADIATVWIDAEPVRSTRLTAPAEAGPQWPSVLL